MGLKSKDQGCQATTFFYFSPNFFSLFQLKTGRVIDMKVWGQFIKIGKCLLIISSIFFLTSCSGIIPEMDNGNEESTLDNSLFIGNENKSKVNSVILEVPYQRYAGSNWCLPASGSMTLNFFGLQISQEELAKKIIKPDGLGDIYKMVQYAQDLGFKASFTVLTMEEIEEYLSRQIPLIAIQEYKESNPLAHARVITGFNSETQEVISNDPTIGKGYTLSYENFMDLNLTANPKYCMTIVITPESFI